MLINKGSGQRSLAILLALTMFISILSAKPLAAPVTQLEGERVIFTIGQKHYIRGQETVATDIAPYIKDIGGGLGRIMVPVAFLAAALGTEPAQWYPEERMVVINKEENKIAIYIDSKELFVNGQRVEMDVAAEIVDIGGSGGRTMVPIAHIARALGVGYKWVNDTKSVYFYGQSHVYGKAGTFGPDIGQQIIEGAVIVRAPGVNLNNLIIEGQLTIAEEVGDGDVHLNNIKVEGKTYIKGGGIDSIYINGGSYQNITVLNVGGQVRIVANGLDKLELVIGEEAKGELIVLEGNFERVIVTAPEIRIITKEATVIEHLEVLKLATGAKIDLAKETVIKTMVAETIIEVNRTEAILETQLKGSGQITEVVRASTTHSEVSSSRRNTGLSPTHPPNNDGNVDTGQGGGPGENEPGDNETPGDVEEPQEPGEGVDSVDGQEPGETGPPDNGENPGNDGSTEEPGDGEPGDDEAPGAGEDPQEPGEGADPGEGKGPDETGPQDNGENPSNDGSTEEPGDGEPGDDEAPGAGEDPQEPGEGADPGEGKGPDETGPPDNGENPGNDGSTEEPGDGEPGDDEAPGAGEEPQEPSDDETPSEDVPPPGVGDQKTFILAGEAFSMRLAPAATFVSGTGSSTATAIVGKDFWIAETEVTYALWHQVYTWALSQGYIFANPGTQGNNGGAGAPSDNRKYEPVTFINWRDAIVWSNALTEYHNQIQGTDYSPVYRDESNEPLRDATRAALVDKAVQNPGATGFRLPSSNEWELAARWQENNTWLPSAYASGATGPTTNSLATTAVAWYNSNSGLKTHSVGQKSPNYLGLYDMSGNVWEWTYSLYRVDSIDRIARGGGYNSAPASLQAGNVGYLKPDTSIQSLGFRLAKSAK